MSMSVATAFMGGSTAIPKMVNASVNVSANANVSSDTTVGVEVRTNTDARVNTNLRSNTNVNVSTKAKLIDKKIIGGGPVVCCMIAPVVPNPIPRYKWTEKEACAVNCQTNPSTGVKECMLGVSKKIVDDNFCENSSISRSNASLNEHSRIINKKAKPINDQKNNPGMIKIGEQVRLENGERQVKSSDVVKSVRLSPGSNAPTLYANSGSKIQTPVNAKAGFSMKVRASNGSEEVLTFKSSDNLWNKMIDGNKKIEVKTRKTLVSDKNGLGVETSNGTKRIKVLPSQASDRAKEVLNETFGDIELKEKNGKVFYDFNEKKKVKFLGFIPVKARFNAQVDAETGELIKSHKPWFLAISSNN